MARALLGFAVLWTVIALGLVLIGVFVPRGPLASTIISSAFWAIGVIFLGVAALFYVLALITHLFGRQRDERSREILENGVETTAVITYLDRNYGIRVGGRAPYSILEYRYTDDFGQEHVVKDRWANAERIIRKGWRVGNEIPIRYLPKEPGKSAVVFETGHPLT